MRSFYLIWHIMIVLFTEGAPSNLWVCLSSRHSYLICLMALLKTNAGVDCCQRLEV